jgi:hypothetical protein
VVTAPGDARRSALNAAKLAALVDARWGPDERVRHPFGSGAALTGEVDGTPTAWTLVDQRAERALGPALLWAERQGIANVHLVVAGNAQPAGTATAPTAPTPDDLVAVAGPLARQAGLFAAPEPTVWWVSGTSLAPATPTPAALAPVAPVPPELVDLLHDAGLEVVVEDGTVRGELNGLEVARIATGVSTAGVPLEAPLLEVGVGRADRELTGMLHGNLAPVDQLDRVVEIVRQHRRAGAEPHPLNQLVPERWLRALLAREPGLAGLAVVRPAEGAHARKNLRERDIAVARGEDADGEPVVVACAVGAHLDLVPLAADARAAVDPGARLLLAVPERDDLAGNRRLACRLRAPADVVTVPGDWRR